MNPLLSKSLEKIYSQGTSSMNNTYLDWLGRQFIQPNGLGYEYFDLDPIASYGVTGIYPALVGPYILDVDLPEDLEAEVIEHYFHIKRSTSDEVFLLAIELDKGLNPNIKIRRAVDQRNSRDLPLIELKEKVESSTAFFDHLKASLGITKMVSDELIKFIVDNEKNDLIQNLVIDGQYDELLKHASSEDPQSELILQ